MILIRFLLRFRVEKIIADPKRETMTQPEIVPGLGEHPHGRHALGRKPDVVTHDLIQKYPQMYMSKRVEKSPNLASITTVDLTAKFPPVYDQGALGSCTANAILGAYVFEMIKQKEDPIELSRLFLYYEERAKEGTTSTDAGAAIQDGVWVLQNGAGVCRESLWPYDITQFASQPPPEAYADATNHRVVTSQRLSGQLNDLRQTLVNGDPIVFGIEVYSSFEGPGVDKTGVIPMPNTRTEQLLGGHAILLVGYNDSKQLFKFRNSWGQNWGVNGYGFIPYAYVTSRMASDFWVMSAVNDTPVPTPPPPTPTPQPGPSPPVFISGTYYSSVPLPAGLAISFQ
jgi:C1A family cysteine protease